MAPRSSFGVDQIFPWRSTKPAGSVRRLHATLQVVLSAATDDLPPERMLDLFTGLAEEYDTDVNSPLNMGYYCIDADLESLAALRETDRHAANIGVGGQHPAALAFELYSIDLILKAFSIDASTGHGHYTSGGTEANMTAMIVALSQRMSHRLLPRSAINADLCCSATGKPERYEYVRHGTLPLTVRPTVYIAPQTHASIRKNARCLLGSASVREVPMDSSLRMDAVALDELLAEDLRGGRYSPFFVVATIGATGSGIIDPLESIGEVCRRHKVWLHVDAPWGGIAAFSDIMKAKCLGGIEHSDSITFDPHKTLVPLGAGGTGAFLTRHRAAVEHAFNVSDTPVETYDYPYMSLQGSRVNNGLRVLSQLVQPRKLAARIEREAALGDLLRMRLRATGWAMTSDTPLPVVTAMHPAILNGGISARVIVRRLARKGVLAKAESLRPGEPDSLRLGIISRRTSEADVELVAALLDAEVAPLDRRGNGARGRKPVATAT